MTDLRAVRNRTIFALVVVALIAVWLLRLAFRLTGMVLALVAAAAIIVVALGWMSSKLRRHS